jgi:uncharacterized protein YqgC (DUF456 family)
MATMTVKKGRLLGAFVGGFSFLTTYTFTTYSYRHAESLLFKRSVPKALRIASGSLVSVLVEFTS